MDYYSTTAISEHVSAIHAASGEILYLVRGSDGAILIDTCCGIAGLRDYLDTLTDLPLRVLLTHGHVDHAMGAPEFEEVYLAASDRKVYDEMAPLSVRQEYLRMALGGGKEDIVNSLSYVDPYPVHFRPLEDGQLFDLGGASVQPLAFPGHTHGMMAMLIEPDRILLVGDGCNPRTFLFDDNSLSVGGYRSSVCRLRERTAGRYDRVLISHMVTDVPVTILDEAVDLCDEILQGRSDEVPFEFLGHTALMARRIDPATGMRLDGGTFNLVYNPERVR